MTEGFFDKDFRLEELERCGDPLTKLNELIPWEEFRPELERVRERAEERKSPAGRKPFDVVLMFKIMILQSLYNLSDAAVEFQVKDRLSFMRFLGLSLADRVPDEKTVWLFREQLGKLGLESKLFEQFDGYLRVHVSMQRLPLRQREGLPLKATQSPRASLRKQGSRF